MFIIIGRFNNFLYLRVNGVLDIIILYFPTSNDSHDNTISIFYFLRSLVIYSHDSSTKNVRPSD